MVYKIEYSVAAVRDLERVSNEVKEVSRSTDISLRYIDGLMDTIGKKSEFPASGSPLYYENIFTGYYSVTYKAYIAFCRIENDRVRVCRVLFGRSDYMRQLFTLQEE